MITFFTIFIFEIERYQRGFEILLYSKLWTANWPIKGRKQTYNTYNKSKIARAIELLRTSCSMHDVTNRAKNHHERFAKEKTDHSDGMIFLASKMEIQRFAFSSIFTATVIAILFLSVARNMVRILKKNGKKNLFQRSAKVWYISRVSWRSWKKDIFHEQQHLWCISWSFVWEEGRKSRTVRRKRWKAILKYGYELRRDLG